MAPRETAGPPAAPRPARVRVPASTSNLGAGFDCLGLALGLYLDVAYTPAERSALRIRRHGTLADIEGDDVLVRTFRGALHRRGLTAAGDFEASSEIPIARGLGSSAAAVVAGLALAAAVAGETIDLHATLAEAAGAEGHPDNAAPSLLGGLVGVTRGARGDPLAFRLPLSGALGFAWAAPPVEVSTGNARAALPDVVPHTLAARALGRTAALVEGLAHADPDLLRAGFDDELHVPWRLPLIPAGREALRAAVDAGAIAATISGSGSGLLAVCPPGLEKVVATAMADAFLAHSAEASWREGVIAMAVETDPTGARVLPP